MAPRDATSLVAVHRELRRRCTTTSPTLERFFASTKQSMSPRFERLAEVGAAEVVPGEFRDHAHLWRVQRDMAFVLVVWLKRKSVVARVIDMAYRTVSESKVKKIAWRQREGGHEDGDSPGELLVDYINEVALEALKNAEAEISARPDPLRGVDRLGIRDRILGVTIAVPTPVFRVRTRNGSRTNWEMRSASRWITPGLRDVSGGGARDDNLHGLLRSALRKVGLPCERVAVINDASAAALGIVVDVRMNGARRPPRDMAMLWLAEGVGGGIISGHRLITGNAGFAGEIGHVAVRPDGILCRHCGVRGCLETVASTGALERELQSAFQEPGGGVAYDWAEKPPIVRIGNETRHHPAYTEAMREAGWWTGIALAHMVNLLNPQLVVVLDQHGADDSIQDIRMPAPVRDEQFQRSAVGALRRNSLDPAYRHLTGEYGARETFGVQFGVHSNEPNGIDVSEARASILPMIGAAADMVDTFSEDYFNRRLTEAHAGTPRR